MFEKEVKAIIFDHLEESKEITLYEDVIRQFEKPLIEQCLKYTGFNKTETAKLLGLNRGTLHSKCKKLGICK